MVLECAIYHVVYAVHGAGLAAVLAHAALAHAADFTLQLVAVAEGVLSTLFANRARRLAAALCSCAVARGGDMDDDGEDELRDEAIRHRFQNNNNTYG